MISGSYLYNTISLYHDLRLFCYHSSYSVFKHATLSTCALVHLSNISYMRYIQICSANNLILADSAILEIVFRGIYNISPISWSKERSGKTYMAKYILGKVTRYGAETGIYESQKGCQCQYALCYQIISSHSIDHADATYQCHLSSGNSTSCVISVSKMIGIARLFWYF